MWMAVVAENRLVPQAVPKFSVNALYIKVSWASFSLYCFQWLSTNHRISGRGDSNLVENPRKITILFCSSVVVLKDCNSDDLVFRHPKPWALQHVAPRRRWGGNCQWSYGDCSWPQISRAARGCFTCFFFKGSREMDTFLDVQMLGTKPKTLLLERTWWIRTFSDFVCWIQKHLSPKMDRPFWLGNRNVARSLLDIIAFLRSV